MRHQLTLERTYLTLTIIITVPAKYGDQRTVIAAVFNSYDGITLSTPVPY